MIAAWVLLMAAAPAPLACGAATRPGVAELGVDGVWRGRAVDLCRAAAEHVGGLGAPIAFHSYDSLAGLRAAAADEIAFVSRAEQTEVPTLRGGLTVAVERQVLVVKTGSTLTAANELGGKLVCFIVGTRAEDALDAWAARERLPVERLAFQEPLEMQDAFDVGKCAAEAVDAAEMNSGGDTRTLGALLAATPIMAATPAAADDFWREIVAALAKGS